MNKRTSPPEVVKDRTYHISAIEYNEVLAKTAEKLSETLEHPEIQRWCRGVGLQHRFHEKQHKTALERLEHQETGTEEKSVAEQQAQFAKDQESVEEQV